MAYSYGKQKHSVFPADICGCSKTMSVKEFASKEYATRMPAQKPNTTVQVVAVAAPVDGNEAPDDDGWFLSDFYLFRHLLSPLLTDNGTQQSPQWNQIWMTAVAPHTLVERHGQYTHGQASDCRVVLDQRTLPEASKSVSVVRGEELRQRFLETVRNVALRCAADGRPLLIMMFGHGSVGTGSVYIGGSSPKDLVSIENLRLALGRHIDKTTLYTTSCYSGHWSNSLQFPTSSLAAADAETESLSHPEDSMYAYPGSRFSTAMLQTLIKTEDYDVKGSNYSNLTFAALIDVFMQTLKEDIKYGADCTVSFAARGDSWADPWWTQSAFPMLSIPSSIGPESVKFKAQWEALQVVPPTRAAGTGAASVTAKGRALKPSQARSALRMQAKEYLDSKPGSSSYSGNQGPASLCRRVLSEEDVPPARLQRLSNMLTYRLGGVVRPATSYKQKLKISGSFPDCNNFDAFEYPRDNAGNLEKSTRYNEIFALVAERELFPDPDEVSGYEYAKGVSYLAAALTEEGWSVAKAKAELAKLQKLR
ncbi:hypothetical protein MMC10_007624 [Thelotrema lepadinum]|nr:hypothetical protein [Thelotrema lepadinum]